MEIAEKEKISLGGAGLKLEDLKFDNLALRALPLDEVKENYPRTVPNACFSIVDPTPIEDPELVCASDTALAIVGIAPEEMKRKDFAEIFSGGKVLKGARPAAHCYCGHQFGYFSGQLGDGATMYLGEIVNKDGKRWEIQYKGAGKTPYSRTADGRKVLRSSIREFLACEAMAGLGIPTTRSPTCVTSRKTKVVRDIFYDGNPIREQCTVITRLCPTFLRFGSFEIVKPEDEVTKRAGPSANNAKLSEKLLQHTIKTYYPDLWKEHSDEKNMKPCYLQFYKEICQRTASLVAMWQCVGWCHGVLNTDNMSIIGVTIDYGPYGFMERTDPDYICNHSDNEGRYSYKNQPEMCKWNLGKLAEALGLCVDVGDTKKVLEDVYDKTYQAAYYGTMKKKLGLSGEIADEDKKLVDGLLGVMAETGADFTSTFRSLSKCVRMLATTGPLGKGDKDEYLDELLAKNLASHKEILEALKPSMPMQQLHMLVMMARQQPSLVQRFPQLITDLKKLQKFQDFQKMPEEARVANASKQWTEWLSIYRTRLLKQAGADAKTNLPKAADAMDRCNPKYILRNYVLQEAIALAEENDYRGVQALLKLVRNPYLEDPKDTGLTKEQLEKYAGKPPLEAAKIAVT
mmetsp:Transcript_36806/g.70949  ORF Transcript_36806/g.70949 Transcript_36806/m.70949 type:complete len:629 (-) Transcript_36806:321-2207(-)